MIELTSPVTAVPYIGPKQAEKLERLEIHYVVDLLLHFPTRYQDSSEITPIEEAKLNEKATIVGKVKKVENVFTRSRKTITKADIQDDTGVISLVWFNQPYIVKSLWRDNDYMFMIKQSKRGSFYCENFEKYSEGDNSLHVGRIAPQYSQTAGISSKWLRSRIRHVLDNTSLINNYELPLSILKSLDYKSLTDAIDFIHFPDSKEDMKESRDRLKFDELLSLQIEIEKRRKLNQQKDAISIDTDDKLIDKFIDSLPFNPTDDQINSIQSIHKDFQSEYPMHRLLNGDVGSGKTVIAIAAALSMIKAGYSVIVIAPTTILAKQHYQTFNKFLKPFKLDIDLITSDEQHLTNPETPSIIIGTHALLYRDDLSDNTALVIVDEQHRFGVEQRKLLREKVTKDHQPHYLMMTATPIPRTLTNTIFGEMDVSFINTMPSLRTDKHTHLVPTDKRGDCYNWIVKYVKDTSSQVFFVSPVIEEDKERSNRSVKANYEKLSKSVFKDLKTGLLHGKLKEKDKNQIMEEFSEGKLDILFSTTVIEVGVDVPNANVMVIEAAESFGLAQLHQLRGRVGRGDEESYCYLLPSEEEPTEDQQDRLKYFSNNDSGFKIAEYDLKRRGPGEVYGKKQSGIPDLLIASIFDRDIIAKAKEVAYTIVNNPDGMEYSSLFTLKRDLQTET